MTDRREFLERLALGAAAFSGLSALTPDIAFAAELEAGAGTAEDFDLTWPKRLTGKYKAIWDIPEIDSAYGVWRSHFYPAQVQEHLKAKPSDISNVLVLRHFGIFLAMQQAFWDKYGVGKAHNATHPITQQGTERNPALLSSTRNEIDKQFDSYSLQSAIDKGSVVLGCNVAMEFFVVPTVAKVDNVPVEEARKRAHALLIPGVLRQPSGVFAALYAQENGCKYIRAS